MTYIYINKRLSWRRTAYFCKKLNSLNIKPFCHYGMITKKGDDFIIFEDKISSLRRFKDDVREVASGYECGVGLERFNDIKEGDVFEAFIMEEVER